jgi:arylsulfatase A-like enzyme
LVAPRLALGVAGVAIVTGPVSTAHVDTRGLERHGLVAFVQSAFPRIRASPSDTDFRQSIVDGPAPEDLGALRGRAAGQDVILVVLESTAARYLATYGAAQDPMPNLTDLARGSLVFDRAYAVYPESIKGLVSTLASRYPAFDVAAEDHAPLLTPSLASALAGAGYHTALFHSGRFMYLGMDAVLMRAGFSRLEDAGDIGGHRESSFGIDEESAVARLLAWIDAVPPGERFFATFLPIAGHHPYGSSGSGPFPAEREVDRYRNALHDADAALGRLREGLQARGREHSTLLVVAADHGEAFNQHAGNYGHTLALYDENVRVPLVISAPQTPGMLGRTTRVASLIDLPPTILELVGVDVPASFDGASLLRGPPRAALFFTDYSLGLLGLRDGCWKFIFQLDASRAQLFDACNDPEERTNLAGQHPALVSSFRARLDGWAAAQVARVRAAASLPY